MEPRGALVADGRHVGHGEARHRGPAFDDTGQARLGDPGRSRTAGHHRIVVGVANLVAAHEIQGAPRLLPSIEDMRGAAVRPGRTWSRTSASTARPGCPELARLLRAPAITRLASAADLKVAGRAATVYCGCYESPNSCLCICRWCGLGSAHAFE